VARVNDGVSLMRQTFTLGRLFDIRVGVHITWFAVYVFATLSIARNISGVARPAAIGLAAICALLLFASVIAHEFAHALVARAYGVRTKAITLFLFGGVATLECEPPTPGAEVIIALAGPAMSAALGALAFGVLMLLERAAAGPFGEALALVVAYVALANGVLAAFNLTPAFPMDGGRVLRAAVWRLRKSRAAATGAASIIGLVLAAGLAGIGVASAFVTRSWQGAWYVLIGAFLLWQGWQHLVESRYAERLERTRVGDVMDAPGADDVAGDAFSLASSATALDAITAFRSSDREQIAVVDAGRLSGWLHRERMLHIFDRAA
jgi:Zn-dependent protease